MPYWLKVTCSVVGVITLLSSYSATDTNIWDFLMYFTQRVTAIMLTFGGWYLNERNN